MTDPSVERPTRPPGHAPASVMVCTPCYGGMANIVFFNSLLRLQTACRDRGVNLEIRLTGGDALITRARSRMAMEFLASQHTHLLFVDADIGFEPDHLFRLLAFDKPLVGGVYPLKKTLWEKIPDAVHRGAHDLQAAALGYVIRFIPNPEQSVQLEEGFGQVAYLATGFMLIRREVLTAIEAEYPELRCIITDMNAPPAATVMFFESLIEPENREHLSEDYAFCWRWRRLGGEIWADFQTKMTHVGHAQYTGSLIAAMSELSSGRSPYRPVTAHRLLCRVQVAACEPPAWKRCVTATRRRPALFSFSTIRLVC